MPRSEKWMFIVTITYATLVLVWYPFYMALAEKIVKSSTLLEIRAMFCVISYCLGICHSRFASDNSSPNIENTKMRGMGMYALAAALIAIMICYVSPNFQQVWSLVFFAMGDRTLRRVEIINTRPVQ